MIDPTQLPILMKAIDFIFEEGHKILEERRERRKVQENPGGKEVLQEPTQEATAVQVLEKDEIKQELLQSKIDEILWQHHEMDIQHLVRLLETYSRNYQIAKEQYAKWGSALVPPIIVHNMNEAESAMLETIRQLESILSKVYKKDIHPGT